MENYKIDFPRSDVIDNVASLKKCILPKARILEIANLSKSTLLPESKTENLRNRNAVSYGDIALYSTSEGCKALASVTLAEAKNFGGGLASKLPKSFRYPLYLDATYTFSLRSDVFFDNRWHNKDYGDSRTRLKKYRYASELEGVPLVEKYWISMKNTRQGDFDTSKYAAEIPSYIIQYYADSHDAFEYLQISRTTALNKTSNKIGESWSENGFNMARSWLVDGSVVTVPYGISKIHIPGQGLKVSCSDKDEAFAYFRVENEYDCIEVAKSEYGKDGVYFDENVAWAAKQREAEKRKKEEAAERQRLAEINERKYREKVSVIQAYINQDAALRSALSDIVQIGSEKKTVEWIVLQNRFGAEECETRVRGEYFKSNACESNWEALMKRVKNHYSSLDTSYRKQRDWFAGLFGKNASLVESLVDERVVNAPSVDEIKQHYTPAFQQLRRITDAEASAERSARKRQEQQMMADFMNNIKNTFERTNRMLDRNMAQTQRVVNQAYASQRSSGNYAGSGYQVRSNAPAMRDLDKKLENIDRSFSTNSGTKDRPDIASAPVKPSHRVCGGPFTVPAMNKVFDIKALNSGKASPPIECSAGGSPVMKGSYNLEAQHINWLMQPPNYKKEAIRNENGRPSGRFRVSWDAFRYECLCSNRSGGQRSGSYQQ